jgi:hypothetical protein
MIRDGSSCLSTDAALRISRCDFATGMISDDERHDISRSQNFNERDLQGGANRLAKDRRIDFGRFLITSKLIWESSVSNFEKDEKVFLTKKRSWTIDGNKIYTCRFQTLLKDLMTAKFTSHCKSLSEN